MTENTRSQLLREKEAEKNVNLRATIGHYNRAGKKQVSMVEIL